MIEDEARYLLAMADEIILSRPQSAGALAAWRQSLFSFISDIGQDSIAREAELERFSLELRAIWLQIAHEHTDQHLKSPLKGQKMTLPLGQSFDLTYERLMLPTAIEARCKRYRPAIPGWAAGHLLFRNGMAAITSLLQCIRPYFFGRNHPPIAVDFFGGYFETQRTFDMLSSPLMTFQRYPKSDDFLDAVEVNEADVLFVEPVSYDWDMEVLELDRLYSALRKRQSQPKMIVVDTTIVGHTFPLHEFLKALPGDPPPVVVQISSGLKLDQEGLELSNAGILSIYGHETAVKTFPVNRLLSKLSGSRKINGAGLSAYETALLDTPWFLNPKRFADHSNAVFQNNKTLAVTLSAIIEASDGIFEKVSHPSLSAASHLPWAAAPFVVFHFREAFDHESTHARVTETLLKHSSRDGIGFFGTGMSFGFRSHRFEIIKPEKILHPKGTAKGLLKVAMGSRNGPMASAVTELLTNLAKLKPGR